MHGQVRRVPLRAVPRTVTGMVAGTRRHARAGVTRHLLTGAGATGSRLPRTGVAGHLLTGTGTAGCRLAGAGTAVAAGHRLAVATGSAGRVRHPVTRLSRAAGDDLTVDHLPIDDLTVDHLPGEDRAGAGDRHRLLAGAVTVLTRAIPVMAGTRVTRSRHAMTRNALSRHAGA
jgi:hypothetical protein